MASQTSIPTSTRSHGNDVQSSEVAVTTARETDAAEALNIELSNSSYQAVEPDQPNAELRFNNWHLLLLAILLFAAFSAGAWFSRHTDTQVVTSPINGTFAGENTASSTRLMVHVAGHVKHPGVYTLPFDARVYDAIQRAGGATADADIDAINLAGWVEDGSRIEVPAKAAPTREATAPSSPPMRPPVADASIKDSPPADPLLAPEKSHLDSQTAEIPVTRALPLGRVRHASLASDSAHVIIKSPSGSKKPPPDYLAKHPVHLNTATAADLEQLPGVGPVMAEKILAYRHQVGGFKSVEELTSIPGIGPKKYARLSPLVVIR